MAHERWRREETILALDLYIRSKQKGRKPNPVEISQHVELLDRLGFPSRSYASIHMKMGNFASLDPDNPSKGLDNPSSQDRLIWIKFANSCGKLRQEVSNIERGSK